jgi:hypothetical protein
MQAMALGIISSDYSRNVDIQAFTLYNMGFKELPKAK